MKEGGDGIPETVIATLTSKRASRCDGRRPQRLMLIRSPESAISFRLRSQQRNAGGLARAMPYREPSPRVLSAPIHRGLKER